MTLNSVTASCLSEGLISAYRATRYRVLGVEPFDMGIGTRSEGLAQLYALHGCGCAAFLTGWNPEGQLLSSALNEAAHARLILVAGAQCVGLVPGFGQDPSGQWPGETSLLALGLPLEAARDIGRQFRQNAIVWAGDDAVPQLILLR